MSWSDAFNLAQRHELLSNVSDHEPKTAIAYVTLKTHLAMRGSTGLWADERHLASLARCTRSWWRKRAWPALRHLFVEHEGHLFAIDAMPPGIGAADTPADPGFTKATSIAASKAALARWDKARQARPAAPDVSASPSDRMRAASDPHMRSNAAIVENQYLGHTKSDAESDADRMRIASGPHEGALPRAYAHAPAPPPPSDSVLSDSDSKPASQEESAREGEGARAYAGDAQPCGSDADASAAHAPSRRERKHLNWLARQERRAQQPPPAIKVPLPDDWQPSADGAAIARELGHHPEILARHFRNHYRAQDARMADWDAAFASWCHREPSFDPEKARQRHLPPMGLPGGTPGQPKAAGVTMPEDGATRARVAAAEAWAPPDLAAQWARVRDQVRVRIGPVAYRTWLADMALAAIDGDEVVVQLPSAFVRDHVAKDYASHLTQLWRVERPDIRRMELRVASAKPDNAAQALPAAGA